MNKEQQNIMISAMSQLTPVDANSLLIEFTKYEMMARLSRQREKDFSGWQTRDCSNKDLLERLKRNLKAGDMLDVINLAAMIHMRKIMFPDAGWL